MGIKRQAVYCPRLNSAMAQNGRCSECQSPHGEVPFTEPGHPLVVAYWIMELFSDFASANAHPSILSQLGVPGTNASIKKALHLLQRVRNGDNFCPLDYADELWAMLSDYGEHRYERFKSGLNEARLFAGSFLDKLNRWM